MLSLLAFLFLMRTSPQVSRTFVILLEVECAFGVHLPRGRVARLRLAAA